MDTINTEKRLGNGPTAIAILTKIFPELKKLFHVSWENISLNNFYDRDFVLFAFSNSDITIPNDNSQYFVVDKFDVFDDTPLNDQIKNNQWRIGFDKNNNFVIYTVRGLQLFVIADTGNAADNNFVTHAALGNYNNTWQFSDTVGYNSAPMEEFNIFAPTMVQRHNFSKGNDYDKMNICAFMYRKMTNDEIEKYIN